MQNIDMNNPLAGKFGKHTLITGILLLILGFVGIALPEIMSLGAVALIATLLIFGGFLWGMHTFYYSARRVADWIKPALLLLTGALVALHPAAGIAIVGLLLSMYLFLDAFGSFAMAQDIHPARGWGWMVFNGLVSLLLALLFLVGWPQTTMWLVGIYISISLIFDGGALIAIGMAMKKL
ncbi:MAG TPA: hypothetical protein ENJ11_03400 [Gammaproteobacteria bacterium]|nr:hypothetical protein [Gammaproteobacteria bacterium]